MSANGDAGWHPRAITSGRMVALGFSLVASAILVATIYASAQTMTLQKGTREIVQNMFNSVRLLGDLARRIDERQLLIERHIVATTPSEMSALDVRIAAADRKVSDSMRAYEPWATLPMEKEVWDRTRRHLAMLDEPIARALGFSRRNADAAARREMASVDGLFEGVDQDVDELIGINNSAANASLMRYEQIRRRLLLTLLGVGLVSFSLALVVGMWASGQVADREKMMVTAANLLAARNRDLDAFAGRVAHDIRGVLASITLAIGGAARRLPADDRSVDILRRGATRMDALVGDLLSLARTDAAGHGRCDPAGVVEQVARDVAPRIETEKGTLRAEADHARVACNEGLLRQAVINLVDNAIKYHRPGVPPDVKIAGRTTDGSYELRITDNGLGMSSDETVKVFEPFYRSPRVHDLPGTGLGLSIVNRIAEAAGGKLSVESQLGAGTTFTIRLRLVVDSDQKRTTA